MKIVSEVHSLEEVKLDLDEVLRKYLTNTKGYKENLLGTDVKIIFGILTTLSTGILFLFSMKYEFHAYKEYAGILVLFFWGMTYLEGFLSRFFFFYTFRGRKEGNALRVLTKIDSPTPIYTVLFYFNGKEIPNKASIDLLKVYNSSSELNKKLFLQSLEEALGAS